jgi:lipopolysaccharide transport system permease protein
MTESFKDIWRSREILYMITWREIRIKYKQSVMGFLWAILMPMMIISAGLLVRYGYSRISGKPLSLTELATVSVKSVPWAFFISSLRFATTSLVSNVNLVTKINFPKEIFPISAIISQLFDFLVASVLLAAVLVFARVGASVQLLWVPVLVGLMILLATGLGVFFSAANLFFRDVKYIVEVIVNFAIFFTPVFYEAELMGKWSRLILLNPAAPLLEGLNAAVVHHRSPDLPWILYSAVVSVLAFCGAFLFFHRFQHSFAENI